jgi:hypothetical protein
VDEPNVPLTTVRGQMPPRSAENELFVMGMFEVVVVDVPQLVVVNDIVVIFAPAESTVKVMSRL